MSWVRLDDRCPEHRKMLAAGPVACWLWVCGLAYANRQPARDGFVPATVLPMLYPITTVARHAERLVEVGLWERAPSGYQIHDFLDYQPGKAEVEQARARKAAAGRVGGIKSGEARRSKSEAAVKHGGSPSASLLPNPHPIPSHPDPIPEGESSPSPLRLTPDQPMNGTTKSSRRRAKSPAPPSDATPEAISAWLAKWAIPSIDPAVPRFLNTARANGRTYSDWTAAWRNWKEREPEFTRPPRNIGHQAVPAHGSEWESALDSADGTPVANAPNGGGH